MSPSGKLLCLIAACASALWMKGGMKKKGKEKKKEKKRAVHFFGSVVDEPDATHPHTAVLLFFYLSVSHVLCQHSANLLYTVHSSF